MILKKLIVFVISYFILTQISLGQNTSELESKQIKEGISGEWQFDNSSSIPVWIAWKEERNKGLNFIAYMEIENYNLENLKKIFDSFSKQYQNALYINVNILTSKRIVHDEVTAKKKGYWSGEDLPGHLKNKEKEDLSPNYTPWYQAGYLRGKDIERLTYYNAKKKRFELINLKSETRTKS